MDDSIFRTIASALHGVWNEEDMTVEKYQALLAYVDTLVFPAYLEKYTEEEAYKYVKDFFGMYDPS